MEAHYRNADIKPDKEQNAMLEAAHQAADAKNREDAAAMLATEAEVTGLK